MSKHKTIAEHEEKDERHPYRVRLPAFLTGDDIGLGDVIKRVTYTFGIRRCLGCERRAATLNSRFVFTGRAR